MSGTGDLLDNKIRRHSGEGGRVCGSDVHSPAVSDRLTEVGLETVCVVGGNQPLASFRLQRGHGQVRHRQVPET